MLLDIIGEMVNTNPTRATAVTVIGVVVFAFMLWVSVIDVIHKSIVFWKMLISSSTIILGPTIISLFYTCNELKSMKWFLIMSIPVWFIMLYLNVRFNREKFIGKADLDLLSAVLSIGLTYSFWVMHKLGSGAGLIKVTEFWYRTMSYLLMGCMVYIAVFIVVLSYKILIKKLTPGVVMKTTKISVIPMFMPMAVAVPVMIACS